MQVNILGTTYDIVITNAEKDPKLNHCDGYTAQLKHLIVLSESNNDNLEYQKRILRHEMVHAFLTESGLDAQSWAENEEIVDWIALQCGKIVSSCLDSIKLLEKEIKKWEKTSKD